MPNPPGYLFLKRMRYIQIHIDLQEPIEINLFFSLKCAIIKGVKAAADQIIPQDSKR